MTPPLPGPENSVAERCDMTDANCFRSTQSWLQHQIPHSLHRFARVAAGSMRPGVMGFMFLTAALCCPAQAQSPSDAAPQNAAMQQLQSEVHELKQLVLQLQQQTVD